MTPETAAPTPAPRRAPVDRPTFDAFIEQLATLSSDEARAVAEVARVPDWRRDGDVRNFFLVRASDGFQNGFQMGYGRIASEDADRTRAAMSEARRTVGDDVVETATKRAAATLARCRLSWPGMRLHRPLRLMVWVPLAAAVVLLVLRGTTQDQAVLLVFMLLLSLAFLFWLAGYLLPPSERDLRHVVELAAVAHVAGPSLAEEHFSQLAGGWYAVLEGRWSRGARPYLAWGCLLAGTAALVILGVVLEVTGAGK